MISGNNVSNFLNGIFLGGDYHYPGYGSDNNVLSGNNLTGNQDTWHLSLIDSKENTIEDNTVYRNPVGINIYHNSDRNTITGNDVSGNRDGIYVEGSRDNLISANNASSNVAEGIGLTSCINTTVSGNTVDKNGVLWHLCL